MNPNTYVGLAILGRWRNTAGAYFDALAKLLADREKFMPPGKPASADVLDFMDRSFDTFENACRRFADVNLELTQFCNVNGIKPGWISAMAVDPQKVFFDAGGLNEDRAVELKKTIDEVERRLEEMLKEKGEAAPLNQAQANEAMPLASAVAHGGIVAARQKRIAARYLELLSDERRFPKKGVVYAQLKTEFEREVKSISTIKKHLAKAAKQDPTFPYGRRRSVRAKSNTLHEANPSRRGR